MKLQDAPKKSRARAIAFYLPQFYPTPENDAWWGKGFTEWTYVAQARPLFKGHYQPHIPADLGFYDLRLPETRAAQAQLARSYGIEAFCYWHYWFAGDRLLQRVFDDVLASGEPDFPFCLGWANHSWTRAWDNQPRMILKEQTYPGEDDYRNHFAWLLKAFQDPRYLKVDGRPLLYVFAPHNIPDCRRMTDILRELARKASLPGIYLVAQSRDVTWIPESHGFDAGTISNHDKILSIPRGPCDRLLARLRRTRFSRLVPTLGGAKRNVRYYRDAVATFVECDLPWKYLPTAIPNWDNTPRRGSLGCVLHDSRPELYAAHLADAVEAVQHLPPEQRIVFIKSWNEWAEGNHLEPDRRFGTLYLEETRRVLTESAGASIGPKQERGYRTASSESSAG